MKWLVSVSIVAVTTFSNTAHADQCAWIDADVASRAQAILAKSPKVIAFCEPCGDKVPGVPVAAKHVDVREPSAGFREVVVDGNGIDLAYTFVQTSASEYANLASLAGCPATGVSPTLSIAPETTSGVLIVADTRPVVAPTPAIVEPAAMEPAVIAPPPQIHVYRTTRYEVAWPMLLVAAAGGFAFGSLSTLLFVATRRRRAMRPRATDLR
jgi:hypothetical protein